MDSASEKQKSPMVFNVFFYLLGLAQLLPWNFFITAETYWQYKLRNTTAGEAWDDPDMDLTPLQVSFTPSMVIVSTVAGSVLLFLTTAIVDRVSEKWRVQGSLSLSLGAMLLITAMTYVDTDDWQYGFYTLTMVLIGLLNASIAILQASSLGIAGMFPTSCVKGMVSGQALAGVFSSLARIISLGIAGLEEQDPRLSGLVYFIIADVTLLLTMVSYHYCISLEYYRSVTGSADKDKGTKQSVSQQWDTYKTVMKKVWPLGFTMSMVLLITMSVYPSVVVYVTSMYPSSQWTEVYFQPTITFLLFNIGDVLGREVTRWVTWPGSSGWGVHILGLSRIVMIPLFLLCHGDNKTFPTLLDNDAYYIILMFIFGISNGYVATLTYIFYPKIVESSELELGGTVMVALCGPGQIIGSLISPAFVALWGPT